MNPSTKDILQAVESTFSDKVIILPNNKNIVLTANQVQSLTDKTVRVVPSETIPQGIVALLAFDYEADFNTNAQIMEKALPSVRSIEITQAVRSTKIGELKIRKKQPIGLLNGDLVTAGDSNLDVVNKVLSKIDLDRAEVVTIYYGAEADSAEAELVGGSIREKQPQLQIEVIRGGQPHYSYIISIE
jgi:dihydroxyacetone kinase-like predicted kinase